MECDDACLFQQWILQWRGAGVTFEIVPVVPGKTTGDLIEPFLGEEGGGGDDIGDSGRRDLGSLER
jgi:hypothetical protein